MKDRFLRADLILILTTLSLCCFYVESRIVPSASRKDELKYNNEKEPGAYLSTSSTKQVFDMSQLVPEAGISGWACAHSTGRGGCFLSTAVYITGIASKCYSCFLSGIYSPPQPTNSEVIQPPTDSSKCSDCVKAVTGDRPTCGGKFLGIGSGRKGRSCKLIDGKGCWPLSSAPILHDCGIGKECRFKVSKAKAKIWCCRKHKSCKWYAALCKVRNLFRCSNQADSSSKDRDGAQVIWQE